MNLLFEKELEFGILQKINMAFQTTLTSLCTQGHSFAAAKKHNMHSA